MTTHIVLVHVQIQKYSSCELENVQTGHSFSYVVIKEQLHYQRKFFYAI